MTVSRKKLKKLIYKRKDSEILEMLSYCLGADIDALIDCMCEHEDYIRVYKLEGCYKKERD